MLYFSGSPVKIISANKLACEWRSEPDRKGTSIKSKFDYSVFKWPFNQFRKTIQHPEHGLPEMIINDMNQGLFLTFCLF